MTAITWTRGSSGNFSTGSNWSGGVVPGSGDDVFIVDGGPYTVTESGTASVNSLTTATGLTFDVTSGQFTISGGANGGTILAASTGSLLLQGTILNSGTISLTDTAGGTIATTGFTNTGTVSESGGGTLTVTASDIYNNQDGVSGLISASGANSIVSFYESVVYGGTIRAINHGTINFDGAGNVGAPDYVTDSAFVIDATSTMSITNGADLYTSGSISNAGLLSIGSQQMTIAYPGNPTPIVTFSGGGRITLAGGYIESIFLESATIVNQDNTISGWGTLGDNADTFINQASGVINANSGYTLTMYGSSVTNAGLIHVTNASTLNFGANAVTNSGTISAADSAIISFANPYFTNSGMFQYSSAAVLVLPSMIENSGTIAIAGGGVAYMSAGTYDNSGTIFLGSGTTAARLLYSYGGSETFEGGGQIVLSDNANTVMNAYGTYVTTVINVDNTISGAGLIGDFGSTFDNQAAATINANQNVALDVSVNILTNEGTLEATASGGLVVTAVTFTNTGTISANGGNVDIARDVSGSGTATVGNYSTLEFGGQSTINTSFLSGTTAILKLDAPAYFTGTIGNFGGADVLDLGGLAPTGATASYNSGTGLLTVVSGGTTLSYSLVSPTVTSFRTASDGNGGTFVVGSSTWIGTSGNDTAPSDAGGTYHTYIGLGGNDTYTVTQSTTQIIEAPGGGTDTVKSSINYVLPANVENLTLTGTSAINGTGNSLNNSITGNTANNILDGSGGTDTLTGGGGSDTYLFNAGYGANTIKNGIAASNIAAGELLFGGGIADTQLWFDQVGNNLKISVLGTHDSVTLTNWFNGTTAYAQLSTINTSANVLVNANLSSLMSAMSAYESNYASTHGGAAFNPATAANATVIVGTPSLLTAVDTAWA